MSVVIRRHYVTVTGRWGQRQVHYRSAGRGPLLLLLHQSPQSSRELEPLMQQWADRFTVVAPDSPGYGLSDPLGVAEAELDDFAAATIEFLDVIGAGRFGVYGFHTGGMIGLALADRYPQRVAAVACNGVAVLTGPERARILAEYLPALEPRWDGGHLAWLWARIREQNVFFPWHERSLATRMDFPMPPPERQQASVLEFLRGAGHYHVAYRAAFTYRAEEVVPRLTVPALITAARWDPICPHLGRLPRPRAPVAIAESATPQEALERCLGHLAANTGPAPHLRHSSAPPNAALWREVIDLDTSPAHVLRGGTTNTVPLLILHDAGGSAATIPASARRLADSRTVLIPDLPGHGETGPAAGTPVDVSGCSGVIGSLLDVLGIDEADVLGIGAGGAVALSLADRGKCKLRRIAWMDPPAIAEPDLAAWRQLGLPSLAADWHGGHLSRAWHMVRDGRLYFPWFRRDQSGIRWQDPDLDDRRIQLEVTELLKSDGAWQSLLSDAWQRSVAQRLSDAGPTTDIVLCAAASSPWSRAAAAIAAESRRPFVRLADDYEGQAADLLRLIRTGAAQ
jgi:pimeloyl-ACP methyl ester carboxylesterase